MLCFGAAAPASDAAELDLTGNGQNTTVGVLRILSESVVSNSGSECTRSPHVCGGRAGGEFLRPESTAGKAVERHGDLHCAA